MVPVRQLPTARAVGVRLATAVTPPTETNRGVPRMAFEPPGPITRMSATVEGSYVESIERVQPNQANNYGNAHGGEVVKLMDELAAIAAMKVAGETCVTAHIGSVDFRSPIAVGDVVELSAYVYDTGESSLQVRVDVDARDPRSTDSRRTTAACFTMVAVDDDGKPVSVPSVTADTERGRELVANAPC